jgi:virginiamycin B lyase
MVFGAAGALVLAGATGCSSNDSSSDTAADRSAPVGPASIAVTAAPVASSPSTTDAASSLTRPADTSTTISTTIGATTSGPASSTTSASPPPVPFDELEIVVYTVPAGSRPHDVAPAADGGVWYTAQGAGALGHLDPVSGRTRHIALGEGSAPHGVIVDGEGIAWVTDGGLNAIVSVDPDGDVVTVFPLPDDAPDANLNTAVFAADGRLWFTGQAGVHGVLDPDTGEVQVFESPRGRGPYGIAATPDGRIFYASLAGNYVGAVEPDGTVTVVDPPTPDQGARRVWQDSSGAIWVSEWNAGQLSRHTPATGAWDVWRLPGTDPSAYAVYVDAVDHVWVSDFGGNAIHRFDPGTESFETFPLPARPGEVRQIHGRDSEVWAAQSADDSIIVIRPAASRP